jgi:hypothetical protein
MVPIDRQPVSGRYRGPDDGVRIELRVDVDGPHPTNTVSADYEYDGIYFGSMRVDAPSIHADRDLVRIEGTASFSWTTKHSTVKVVIPRVVTGAARAPATLAHFTSNGVPGSVYPCAFESVSFRSVALEQACEAGVTPFDSYDTGSLASGGERRTLSIVAAYAEVGIEILPASPVEIGRASAGSNATWSDAELQAAMEQHFTRYEDRPRWAVWMLHAGNHDIAGVLGLMFDRSGLQRQGCAIFYGPMAGDGAYGKRRQLHTCVHELGHTFNLLHSWQGALAAPPIASRPAAHSWMNYPDLFPGGEPAYWPSFGFQFDDLEVAHLRHGFERNVIMGGTPFTAGAASKLAESSDPRLQMSLSAPASIMLGMPVTLALSLSATTARGVDVPVNLGPRSGTVDISIRTPAGDEFVFAPLLRHCRGDESMTLHAHDQPLRDFPFIHYGKGGFVFDRPGVYGTRARLTNPDGSQVYSEPATITVGAPTSLADRTVADLVLGDDQVGKQLALLGSAAPELSRGDDTLQEIVSRFPRHPFADVARLVRASSLARDFKTVDADGEVTVRAADPVLAQVLVDEVFDAGLLNQIEQPGLAGRNASAEALTRGVMQQEIFPDVARFATSRLPEIAMMVPAVTAVAPAPVQPARRPPGVSRFTTSGRFALEPSDDCP